MVRNGEFKITKTHSESQGIVDIPLTSTRVSLTPNGTVLRLGKMRKIEKQRQLQLVIKGKNEILGIEEAIENVENRTHSCQCVSTEGELLFISRDDLNNRISYPDTWAYIRDKYNSDSQRFQKRYTQLSKIEEVKKSLDFSSFSKLPAKLLITDKSKESKSPTYKSSKRMITSPSPKHNRIESTPGPDRLKTEESPPPNEERTIRIIRKRTDNTTPRIDMYRKNKKDFSPKRIVHRRVAPPNFLRNYKERISSRKTDVFIEEIAEKLKYSAIDQSMYSHSTEKFPYKRISKSFHI